MAGSSFVSPTGYIDLDNDCEYSIDLKSTRGREYIDPKEDLAFYFNTYLVPKYGLNDINVNNTASFMKELQMNWSKLDVDLKDKVLDIMVDGIFTDSDFDFKNRFLYSPYHCCFYQFVRLRKIIQMRNIHITRCKFQGFLF